MAEDKTRTVEVRGTTEINALYHAMQLIPSSDPHPTGHTYRVTVEDITEEPQWWFWDVDDGWYVSRSEGWAGTLDTDGNLKWCRVYGTTADRVLRMNRVRVGLQEAGEP